MSEPATLRAELDQSRAEVEQLKGTIDELLAKLSERMTMIERLREFADHSITCLDRMPEQPCACGYAELLQQIASPAEGAENASAALAPRRSLPGS